MDHKKHKNKKVSNWLLSISILLVIGTSFMSGIYPPDANYRGLPIDWLVLHSHHGFEFLWLGFLLDVFIFYFILKVFIRMYKRVIKKLGA
ncbi:hypothetical protein [Bacillus sp. NPDC077027]|uniref:hypothetical protein n=1 Tax=Bacillus sp. NPDC077027 TaxID=3390548 RepID=UPI003D04FFF8